MKINFFKLETFIRGFWSFGYNIVGCPVSATSTGMSLVW